MFFIYLYLHIKHIILTDENTIDMNANGIVDENINNMIIKIKDTTIIMCQLVCLRGNYYKQTHEQGALDK